MLLWAHFPHLEAFMPVCRDCNPRERGEPAISWSDLALAAGFVASIAAPLIYAVMKVGPWLWL